MARVTTKQLIAQLEAAHVSYEALAAKYEALRAECDALRAAQPHPKPRATSEWGSLTPAQRAERMALAKAAAMASGRVVRVN